MSAPNFDVLRPTLTRVERPTLPLAASLVASADPSSATPLMMGEWLQRNTSDQLARPAAPGEVLVAAGPSWPYWEWTGQTDVQASLKGTILLPIYEAWTLVWDIAAAPTGVWDALSVELKAAGAYSGYSILRRNSGAGFTVGYALGPLPTATGQRLYFRANY